MNDKLFNILKDNSESIINLYKELVKEYPILEAKEPVKKTVKKKIVKK